MGDLARRCLVLCHEPRAEDLSQRGLVHLLVSDQVESQLGFAVRQLSNPPDVGGELDTAIDPVERDQLLKRRESLRVQKVRRRSVSTDDDVADRRAGDRLERETVLLWIFDLEQLRQAPVDVLRPDALREPL